MTDISTSASRTPSINTVPFLEKESQPTGSLVSLESVRFLLICSQQLGPTRPLAMGCPHQSLPRKAKPNRALGHKQSQWGMDVIPSGPKSGTPSHCLVLFHMPHFLSIPHPSPFIPVPILPLPTICIWGTMPHSYLLLSRHTAWQCFWFLQNNNLSNETKGLSQVPCALHFPGEIRPMTLLLKPTEQTRQSQYHLFPITPYAETCSIYPLT